MGSIDLDGFTRRSRALDVSDLDFGAVATRPIPAPALRTLRYMQDIESHTSVYLRTMLHTRAIDDPEVAGFLACWFHEEMAHGRALARLLDAAGVAPVARRRSRAALADRVEQALTGLVSRWWPDFVAVHMTWGAINELSTLHGYQRLVARADHPVVTDLLGRIVRDESRHFDFYFHQAAARLRRPGAARVARFLVDRFWRPVGSGVQPDDQVRFVGHYLFDGPAGRVAARRIDATIRRLPGFEDVDLVEAWLERCAVDGGVAATPSTALPAA